MTGICAGLAIASLSWQQAYVELAISAVLVVVLMRIARVVPLGDRGALWRIALAAFAVRAAAGAFLRMASIEIGRDGFFSGDDREYFQLASNFVAYLRDQPRPESVPPYWGGSAYLFGAWVYLQIVLVAIFGDRPLVPILLNGALGALTVLACWDLARRMFGRLPAYLVALLLSFHPSLTLWSSTNLKDTFALFLISIVLWSITRLIERPRVEPLVTIALSLVAMQTVRIYIFVGLCLVLPAAIAFAPSLTARRRAIWTVAAAALSVALLAANQVGIGLGPALVTSSTDFREGMARGARTTFQETPPLRVETGTTFSVPTAAPQGGETPPAAPQGGETPPTVVVVSPNTRIVVVPAGHSVPTGVPGGAPTTYVRPGDVIVVGPPGTSPAPLEQRSLLPDPGQPVTFAPPRVSEDELQRQTLSYLPKGLLYALFAPWPWLSDRAIDVLTVPEMLLWYVAIAVLPFSLAIARRHWRFYLGPLLFVGGTLLIFALVEGNWGTLFRHRAMVIPFVFILASPGLAALVRQTRGLSRLRTADDRISASPTGERAR